MKYVNGLLGGGLTKQNDAELDAILVTEVIDTDDEITDWLAVMMLYATSETLLDNPGKCTEGTPLMAKVDKITGRADYYEHYYKAAIKKKDTLAYNYNTGAR